MHPNNTEPPQYEPADAAYWHRRATVAEEAADRLASLVRESYQRWGSERERNALIAYDEAVEARG